MRVAVAAGLIFLDLVTKKFFGGVTNGGVAWGWQLGDFQVVGIIIAICLWAVATWRKGGWGEVLVLAGGLANLTDRLVDAKISDWLRLGRVNLWFNLADIYIISGMAIILWKSKFFTKTST